MARELLPLTNNQNNFQYIAVIAIVAVSAIVSVIASVIDIHLGSYPENFDSEPIGQAYSLQGPNFDSNFDSKS